MASSIDPTVPTSGTATTASVRENFDAAKTEIEALQTKTENVTTITAYAATLLDDATAADARTTLELGTMATQDASSVAITGGNIDGATIGGTTPAVGTFTTLTVSGNAAFDTNTLFVDAANNRVGIGTGAPQSSLSLYEGDIGIENTPSLPGRSNPYNVGLGDQGITGFYRAKIEFAPPGTTNNVSSNIVFYNKFGDFSSSTLTERMRISFDGAVTLGAAPGSESLRVTPVASAVNRGEVTGATAGNRPTLSAAGSDTNISLGLSPKGTGNIVVPIANVPDYADDAAAAAGGVVVGGIYRTASALKIRVS